MQNVLLGVGPRQNGGRGGGQSENVSGFKKLTALRALCFGRNTFGEPKYGDFFAFFNFSTREQKHPLSPPPFKNILMSVNGHLFDSFFYAKYFKVLLHGLVYWSANTGGN